MASTLVELIRRERDGRVVMIDPNVRIGLDSDGEYRDRLQAMISQSTIVKASDADLAWLYPGMGYEDAADRILGDGARLVVVTLGARGAFAAHRGFHVAVDAVKVVVVDTIGAGDAFGAALLAWLHDHDAIQPDLHLEKEEVKAALEFACLAAALTCARAGADPPWKSEMTAWESR
jgi:fructokinase